MYTCNNIIDCSVWQGKWPFNNLRYSNIVKLEEKLKSSGIKKAFISPLETAFEQDAFAISTRMLETMQGNSFFSPVPVIDLSFQNWKNTFDLPLEKYGIKMVRLLPNYHMYDLTEERLAELVQFTIQKKLLISIPLRLEDSRVCHPLVIIPDVNIDAMTKVLSFFPSQKFIINNAYWGEINTFYHILENAYFDIAMVEPVDPLNAIKDTYSLERVLFSSHCPLFYPEGNLNKLKYTAIEENEMQKTAYKNIEKLII